MWAPPGLVTDAEIIARTAPWWASTSRSRTSAAKPMRSTGSPDWTTGFIACSGLSQTVARASRSSEARSGKYRYAVASDTSARRATSGIVTSPPEAIASRAAATIAVRVRSFWLERPVFSRMVIGRAPPGTWLSGLSS